MKIFWQNLGRFFLPLFWGVVLSLQLGVAPAQATGVYDFPPLQASEPTWIIDQADLFSRLTLNRLNNTLANLAQKTGIETRFVTLHRLDYGETTESLTNQLFERWFPTPEAQANQVLLVLDNVTNISAIRIGSGVESKLAKDIAQSIAQETLMVPVRKGNYNQAFVDASDRLVAVLSGQADPGPPKVVDNVQVAGTFKTAAETESERGSATAIVVVLLIAATVIPMATYYFYQFMQSR